MNAAAICPVGTSPQNVPSVKPDWSVTRAEFISAVPILPAPAQLKQRLIYFGSRPGMDIDGLGDELVDVLLAERLVTNYADLYRLSVENICQCQLVAKT